VSGHVYRQTTMTTNARLVGAFSMGATALWDPWDASPPTLEIVGPSVFGPVQLIATVFFFARQLGQLRNSPPNLLAVFKGRRRGVGKGVGETGVE